MEPDKAKSPRPTPEPLGAEGAGEPGVAGPSGAEAGPCEPGMAGPGEASCEAGSGDSHEAGEGDAHGAASGDAPIQIGIGGGANVGGGVGDGG